MAKFIGKRLLMLLPVVLGVVFIVFTILRLSPTDPIRTVLGDMATEEAVQEMREEMGLNDPFFVQFYNYIKGIVTKFDFGVSYVNRHPVVDEIKDRFPITLELAILSTLLAGLIGIPLGIISAVHQYKLIDNISSVFALIFLAMPGFWFALILIIQFSLKWRLLPASGWYGVKYMILPILANGTGCIAGIMRTTRSNMLEVIRQDYIRTARAKGLKENTIIMKHALRNALIPVVTLMGLQPPAERRVRHRDDFRYPRHGQNAGGRVFTQEYPDRTGRCYLHCRHLRRYQSSGRYHLRLHRPENFLDLPQKGREEACLNRKNGRKNPARCAAFSKTSFPSSAWSSSSFLF